MSSLLDILQKKPAQPATEEPAVAPASAESHMQTVELHLAVDNRDAAEPPTESDVRDSGPEAAVGLQQTSPAAEQHADTGTVADSFANGRPGIPYGDATNAPHAFAASQRMQLLALKYQIEQMLQQELRRNNEDVEEGSNKQSAKDRGGRTRYG